MAGCRRRHVPDAHRPSSAASGHRPRSPGRKARRTRRASEIWVAGSTLSPGYVGRPDLTAERFVTRDFGSGPRRWYRSGEVATRSSNGDLMCLDRLDAQVNLRGFRIELGEIEAALRRDSGVRDAAAAVVALTEDESTASWPRSSRPIRPPRRSSACCGRGAGAGRPAPSTAGRDDHQRAGVQPLRCIGTPCRHPQRPDGTTTSGQAAWCSTAWLTEPSSSPAKPPLPRLPTIAS
jgi:acyl-CoA synthetase (AMP-forming)/AMP-acid ligase II